MSGENYKRTAWLSKQAAKDTAISLALGLLLLMFALAAYRFAMRVWVDEVYFFNGVNPLARIALARLAIFAVCTLPAGILLAFMYRRYATSPRMDNLSAGAALAGFMFLMLQNAGGFDPLPWWFDAMRAALLFAALPFGYLLMHLKIRGRRAAGHSQS